MTENEQQLIKKYKEWEKLMLNYSSQGNYPMHFVYKQRLRGIRTALGILGIHITGITK